MNVFLLGEKMEEKTKTKRDSNIELLRIFCILLIIVHHIVVHGIKPQLESTTLFPAGEMFNNFVFHKRLIFMVFGASFGKIANNIFILISGYFLCEKVDFNMGKQLKKLLTQVMFASVLLMITTTIYGAYTDKPYTSFIGLSVFNNEWVFIGYYACIIVIGKLFLNKIFQSMDQKRYFEVLLALFAIISLTFSRSLLYSISSHLVILVTGIFCYGLGGYIKKYDLFKNVKTITIIAIILITTLLMIFSYRNSTLNDINTNLISGAEEYHQKINLYEEYSLECIILAVCTFEVFRRMKIKDSAIINKLAGATFMVFLMHDNEFSRNIYRNTKWIEPYHDNIWSFFGMLLILTMYLYVLGVVVYAIYSLIIKAFNKSE